MKKLGIICAVLLLPVMAFASNPAEIFIHDVENRILTILSDEAMDDSQKEEQLNGLFDDVVDVEWIGKFVLGKYWRKATDVQKKEFLETYREFLQKNYVSNFKKYDGEKVDVKDSRDEGKGKYFVKTAVVQANGKALDVNYKIHSQKGEMKVFDIQVEGVSLLSTQREEFSSVVSREGLDSLIGKMKFRLKSL